MAGSRTPRRKKLKNVCEGIDSESFSIFFISKKGMVSLC